jgi:PPE-repeat protein
VFDFAALPPEINSARIVSGPGSAPMVKASVAWQSIAAELNSVAAQWSSVIAGVKWMGPSSIAMRTVAAQQFAWLSQTAANAEMTATLTGRAASAYETVRASIVPVPVIVANRAQLSTLVSANVFGQNTAAIAETEMQYMQMWAQDVASMLEYQSSSGAATSGLSQFTPVMDLFNIIAPDAGNNPGIISRLLTNLADNTTPLGFLNEQAGLITQSGSLSETPIGLPGLFSVLWGVTAPSSVLHPVTVNNPPPTEYPYPPMTPTASRGTSITITTGGLSSPRMWGVAPNSDTPGPVTVLDRVPEAAGPRLGAVLPMPLPLPSASQKADQERARYGYPVRMLPEKPYL